MCALLLLGTPFQVEISQDPCPAVVGEEFQIVCDPTPFTADLSITLSINGQRVEDADVVNGTIFIFAQVTFEFDGQQAQCVVVDANQNVFMSDFIEINTANPCKSSCTYMHWELVAMELCTMRKFYCG